MILERIKTGFAIRQKDGRSNEEPDLGRNGAIENPKTQRNCPRTHQYEQMTHDALVGRARLQGAQNFRVVRGNVSKLD